MITKTKPQRKATVQLIPELEDAILLATDGHKGQRNFKSGEDYILHPLRVMNMVREDAKMVAILHDVPEDTKYSLKKLLDLGFSGQTLAALELLTKKDKEEYQAFIDRIAASGNRIAIEVKLADLCDNLDSTRLTYVIQEDGPRWDKYFKARNQLLKVLESLG